MEFDGVVSKRARPRSPKPIAPRSSSPPPFSTELNLDHLKLAELSIKPGFRKIPNRPQTAAVLQKPSWKIEKRENSVNSPLESDWKVSGCTKRPKSAISSKHYTESKSTETLHRLGFPHPKSFLKKMLRNQICQLSSEMSRLGDSTKSFEYILQTNEMCKRKAANLAEEYKEKRKILKTYNAVLELHLKRMKVSDIKQSVDNLRSRKQRLLNKAEEVVVQKRELQAIVDALSKDLETVFQKDVDSLGSLPEKNDYKQKFKENSKLVTEIKLLEQKIWDCKSQKSNLGRTLSKSFYRIQKTEILKQIYHAEKKLLFSSNKAIVELEKELRTKEEYFFHLTDKSSIEKLKKLRSREALMNAKSSDYSKTKHSLENTQKAVVVALSYLSCVETDISTCSSIFSVETWKVVGNRYINELENLKDKYKTMESQVHKYSPPDEVVELKEIAVIKQESLKHTLQEAKKKLEVEECHQLRLMVQLNNTAMYKDILELERLIEEVENDNEDVSKKLFKENQKLGLVVDEAYKEIHQMTLYKNDLVKSKLRKK